MLKSYLDDNKKYVIPSRQHLIQKVYEVQKQNHVDLNSTLHFFEFRTKPLGLIIRG